MHLYTGCNTTCHLQFDPYTAVKLNKSGAFHPLFLLVYHDRPEGIYDTCVYAYIISYYNFHNYIMSDQSLKSFTGINNFCDGIDTICIKNLGIKFGGDVRIFLKVVMDGDMLRMANSR